MSFPADRPQPRATYRLQLNRDFTFAHAEVIAPYLEKLGISHVYLSPILMSRAGSTHGYDCVDHTRLDPELGSLDDFRRMAATLRRHGLGIILDIVPNHMGIGGSDNPYWLDLLEWGRDSRYAQWFDVNWSPSEPSLHNKVLVPFLGCSAAEALETGRLTIRYDAHSGSFSAWAEDAHKLPLAPRTYGDILKFGRNALMDLGQNFEDLSGPAGAEALKQKLTGMEPAEVETALAQLEPKDIAALIARQNWRAARYSVAADDINYRRFFIVSDLGAIRIERDEVFDHAHRLIFQLVEEGWVDGLRIDHIDGLFDPRAYALTLRRKCPRPIYLVVEKILAPHEKLRLDWQVDGTTGYEFANQTIQLLTDPAAEETLSAFYASFTGRTATLGSIERQAKLDIIDYEMAAELDALTARLTAIAHADPATADLTRNGIRNALRHLVSEMAVYRTYLDTNGASDADRDDISAAIQRACAAAPTLDPALFAFLESLASGELRHDAALDAAMRLQQFTGPVMAKGLEDTALYRFNRLLALSDVGELPDVFYAGPERFHAFNAWRSQNLPLGMLTSSSHDTKRGEDVRARIAALTEIPEDWIAAVTRWRNLLEDAGAPEVDANDLYYLFQQLVGAWPAELDNPALAADDLTAFKDRSAGALTKALREAREHTTWTAPNEDYEAKAQANLDALLDPAGAILPDLVNFVEHLGPLGARNSLIAATLKLTAPGVPDIYQGAELYEQSMVDPDNRRPVDFAQRAHMLDMLDPDLGFLLADWRSGAAKLAVVQTLLLLRRDHPALFVAGSYEPLAITGTGTERSLAFLRRHGGEVLLVIASPGRHPQADGARLSLPETVAGQTWTTVIGDPKATVSPSLTECLRGLPVAVFISRTE